MARYCGRIGYATSVEKTVIENGVTKSTGIWEDTIVERRYYGDVIKLSSRWDSSDHDLDNLSISNQISVVADPFAYHNFHSIKYAEYLGTLWKVTNVEVESPRLILTLGGVYNGEQASVTA